MQFVVEPGEFEIMVGNSSRDEDLQKVVLTVAR
jgi:beta-glucosidase